VWEVTSAPLHPERGRRSVREQLSPPHILPENGHILVPRLQHHDRFRNAGTDCLRDVTGTTTVRPERVRVEACLPGQSLDEPAHRVLVKFAQRDPP